MFMIRFGIITFVMVGTLVFQMGKSIAGLTVEPRHIIVVALLAVAVTTVFPVPFTMLLASPPSIVVFGACFVYFWGAQVRQNPSIDVDMKREQAVSRCQVALTFVYPLYISGFVSLSGIYQTMFVAVLPLIKLFARNWVANALKYHNDLKPQAVTFIVEVFSALYVSNALSNSSSWMATAVIMGVDLVVFWLASRDIVEVLNDVELLMEKIPQDHLIAKENFVQVAIRLTAIEADNLPQTPNPSSNSIGPTYLAQIEEWISSASVTMKRDAIHAREKALGRRPKRSQRLAKRLSGKVYASDGNFLFVTQQLKTEASDNSSLKDIFSREERALFIHQTARVLFITEFIILAESPPHHRVWPAQLRVLPFVG
ncbi:hypothetical protein PR002_g899 [Phytophthora rubi]|uniref:Uncharacterized protein n=1 Tax=Phytophthora rubi TaxID=129364 RepID=A0A6A3NSY5_9STRA|nr:hypothetical protein PR002_g899 [Phytophthora rubi]